jgi:hypothetical protein
VTFAGEAADGATMDVSDGGAMVQLASHHDIPASVSMTFRGSLPDDKPFECSVIRTIWIKGVGDRLALRFSDADEDARRRLILQMFSAPDAWEKVTRPVTDTVTSLAHMATSALRRKKPKAAPGAKTARYRTDLPCRVLYGGSSVDGVIENLSHTGAALRVGSDSVVHGEVMLELVRKTGEAMSVRAAVVAKISEASGVARYGVKFVNPPEVEPLLLLKAGN